MWYAHTHIHLSVKTCRWIPKPHTPLKHSYTNLWRSKDTHVQKKLVGVHYSSCILPCVCVCVRAGSHKSDTSGQMRLGQVSSHFFSFLREGGKPMGLDGYSFFPLTFVVSPSSFSPQAGSSVLFYVHVPGRFFFHVDSLSFASYLFVSSLALFLFSLLSRSLNFLLSLPLTHTLPQSLFISVCFPSLPISLSLAPCPFSFPSLPPFLSRSLTRTHIFLSLRRTYTDSPTMLDFLSLLHGLPFPAHWWKMSSTLLTYWRYTAAQSFTQVCSIP